MRKIGFTTIVAASIAMVTAIAGCQSSDEPNGPKPTTTSSAAATTDAAEHESGPESPIGYGLQVPQGAAQLGPLLRNRSAKLIAAYQPALDAAINQKEAEDQQRADEALKNGETVPTPAPTPSTRPSDDTFKPIEDPPRPDSTISFMRVDGNPSAVVNRMISQIAAALPANAIDTTDLATYCTVENNRYTGCKLDETGFTTDNLEIRIIMTVDPGDLATRTSPPAAQTRPLMTLAVNYVGDPAKGQLSAESTDLEALPDAEKAQVPDEVIWPKMDVDADPSEPLLDGKWTVPTGAGLLLSGANPAFVVLHTGNGREADQIAQDFVTAHSDKADPAKDVVEDLNEISTTYRAQSTKKGLSATATYVLSGRGTYVMLSFTPATKS